MKFSIFAIIVGIVLLAGYQQVISMEKKTDDGMMGEHQMDDKKMQMTDKTATAVFAGGCFWCTESDFEKKDGVIEAVSGYAGGHLENPSYKQVSGGGTGHVEAVRVTYDPDKVSYEELLSYFWRHVDPTDNGGQFVDRGRQYRSVVFYTTETQRAAAEASKKKLAESGVFEDPVVTEILPLKNFYKAEEYHQDYYKKNPIRYSWYRSGSGRDRFLKKAWADHPMEETSMAGKDKMKTQPMAKDTMGTDPMKSDPMGKETMGKDAMDKPMQTEPMEKAPMHNSMYNVPGDMELKKKLTPLQYKVVRKDGTEPPFKNEFWNHHEDGIYVDIVSGEPLFSSTDKFDSGTGWPSFTKPLVSENVVEKEDNSLFMRRVEVRSKHADSHLGHVFEDGPAPTGLRYCINSASLRFIPKKDLEKKGLGKFLTVFDSHKMADKKGM